MADARFVIEMLIKARDDTARAFAEATGNAEAWQAAMKANEREIVQANKNISESFTEVNRGVRELRDETKKGGIATQIHAADNETKQLARSIDETRLKLSTLPPEAHKSVEEFKSVESQIKRVQGSIDELTRKQRVFKESGTANQEEWKKLESQIAKAKAELRLLNRDAKELRADEGVRSFSNLERQIERSTKRLQELNVERTKLQSLFERDERANQLERQIVKVEESSRRLAKVQANLSATDQDRINAAKELTANERDLLLLRSEEGKLTDKEAQEFAKGIRSTELRRAQEEQILKTRQEMEKLHVAVAKEDDLVVVARLRDQIEKLDSALVRLQVNEEALDEIRSRNTALEQIEAENRALKEQDRINSERARLDKEEANARSKAERDRIAAEREILKAQEDVARQAKAAHTEEQRRARERQTAQTNFQRAVKSLADAQIKAEDAVSQKIAPRHRAAIEVNVENAAAEAEKARAILQAILGRNIHVSVEVDTAAAKAQLLAFRALQGAGNDSKDGGISEAFRDASSSIAQFDNFLRGLMSLGITVFFNQLITIAGAAAGALLALASSALYAGGALGGALVAGIAQAIPVLGVLGVAVYRLKAVFDVVQQAQLVQQQQSSQGMKQDKRSADSSDALRSAQERLADAHRRVAEAQKGLTQAREDARKKLEDLILAEKDQTLSAKEAQDALRKALSEGRISEIPRAQLRVEESGVQLGRTRSELGQRRAQGISGSPEVTRAQEQLRSAVRAADEAQRSLAKAGRSADIADARITGAIGKLNFLRGRLSDAERELAGALGTLQNRFRHVAQTITEPLISGMTRGIRRITQLMGNKALVGAFRGLAGELTKSIDELFKHFTSARGIKTFTTLIDAAGKTLGPLTKIIENLADLFLNVGKAAGPALALIFKDLERVTSKWVEWTGSKEGQKSLMDFFVLGVHHLEAWGKLLSSIVHLFAAIAGRGGGAEKGLSLIQGITRSIEKLTNHIKANPEGLHKFFATSVTILKQLAPIMGALQEQFQKIFTPGATQAFVKFLTNVLIPALGTVLRSFGFIAKVIGEFDNLPVFGALLNFFAKTVIVGTFLVSVFLKVITVIKPMTALALRAATVTGLIGKNAEGSASKVGLLSGAFDKVKVAVGGVIASVGRLIARLPGLRGIGARLSGIGGRVSGGAGAGGAGGAGGAARSGGGIAAALAERGHSPLKPLFVAVVEGGIGGAGRAGRALTAAEQEAAAAGAGAAGGRFSKLRRIGSGAAIAGGVAATVVGSQIGGSTGGLVSGIGAGAATGAILGPEGAAVGAVLGAGFALFQSSAEKAKKAAAEAQKSISAHMAKLSAHVNVAGLEDMAAKAKEMALRFPKGADAIKALGKAAEAQAEKLKPLRHALDRLHSAGVKRINARDIIDPNAASQVADTLEQMKNHGVRSMTDLHERLKFLIDKTNVGFATGSKEWGEQMATNFGAGIKGVQDLMANGQISTDRGAKEIAKIIKEQMTFARDNMDTLSFEAKTRLGDNLGAAVEVAIDKAGGIEHATKTALTRIRRLMETEFELYGLDPAQARELARNRSSRSVHRQSVNQFGQRDERATGGWIGSPGERGEDAGAYRLGRGEAVLNWAHQKFVEPALHAYHGFGLSELFDRVRGVHAGSAGGFAEGGFAGLRSRVPLSGIGEGVLAAARRIEKVFPGLVITSGRGGGHAKNSYHYRGQALDLGGSAEAMNRAAAFIRRTMGHNLTEGIHNPNLSVKDGSTVPAGFWGGTVWNAHRNHIHIAIAGVLGRLSGILSRGIETPLVRGGGGQIGLAAQLGVNAVAAAANRHLRDAIDAANASPDGSQPEINVGGSQRTIAKSIVSVARSLGAGSKVILAAIETALVESGLRNLDYGDRDSLGVFQQRPSQGWGTASQVMNVPHAAHSFLTRAIANASRYGTAGQLAQSVQRSGYPGRYDLVREDAVRLLNSLGVPGFAKGGIVGGVMGQAVPVVAHAGEWILNKIQQSKLAGLLGTGVGHLKGALGFTGGPTSFAGGGEVPAYIGIRRTEEDERHERRLNLLKSQGHKLSEEIVKAEDRLHKQRLKNISEYEKQETKLAATRTAEQNRLVAIRAGIYAPGALDPRSLSQVHTETGRAFTALRAGGAGRSQASLSRFQANFDRIAGDNGLFDLFTASIERFTSAAALKLRQAVTKFNRKTGQFEQGLSADSALDQQMETLRTVITESFGEEGQLNKALAAVNRRLKRVTARMAHLQQGGLTSAAERQEFAQLDASRATLISDQRGVKDKLQSLAEDRQTAIEQLFEKQIDAFKESTNKAIEAIGTRTVAPGISVSLDTLISLAQKTGGDVLGLSREKLEAQRKQFDILSQAQAEAQRLGYTEYAATLKTQLETLWGEIQSATVDLLQAQIDQIKASADERERQLGRRSIYADIRQRAGDAIGASTVRESILQDRGSSLQQTRTEILAALAKPEIQSNPAFVKELNQQLQDNADAIAQNTQEVKDAATATRQLRIDLISQRAQSRTGIISGLTGIVNAAGTLSGTVSQTDLKELLGQQGDVLREAGTGLAQQLFEAFGIDLRNLHGLDFVNAVQALLPHLDEIMAGLSEAQRTQFEGLINAIIGNEQAVQDNTIAVKDLVGNISQTFKSSAWELFRQAIFNGSGGLLTQYKVPSMQTGGYVSRGGLFNLHAGEAVVPASTHWQNQEGDINVTVNEAGQPIDARHLASLLAFQRRTMPSRR